jgi:hypothetical protein
MPGRLRGRAQTKYNCGPPGWRLDVGLIATLWKNVLLRCLAEGPKIYTGLWGQ